MRILSTLKKKVAGVLVLASAASPAFASTGSTDGDAFKVFMTTVTDWTQGPLGIGLATTMLLMGGAIGVSKNSPMPALSGIAGAAFLNYGPDIIQTIMKRGMLF